MLYLLIHVCLFLVLITSLHIILITGIFWFGKYLDKYTILENKDNKRQ